MNCEVFLMSHHWNFRWKVLEKHSKQASCVTLSRTVTEPCPGTFKCYLFNLCKIATSRYLQSSLSFCMTM